jgi:hypothetical protein
MTCTRSSSFNRKRMLSIGYSLLDANSKMRYSLCRCCGGLLIFCTPYRIHVERRFVLSKPKHSVPCHASRNIQKWAAAASNLVSAVSSNRYCLFEGRAAQHSIFYCASICTFTNSGPGTMACCNLRVTRRVSSTTRDELSTELFAGSEGRT